MPDKARDEGRELIEAAMAGVRVIVCWRCNGLGVLGLASFQCHCPVCLGCGETTTNDLEVKQ
jgi:hypothetical protein